MFSFIIFIALAMTQWRLSARYMSCWTRPVKKKHFLNIHHFGTHVPYSVNKQKHNNACISFRSISEYQFFQIKWTLPISKQQAVNTYSKAHKVAALKNKVEIKWITQRNLVTHLGHCKESWDQAFSQKDHTADSSQSASEKELHWWK